uniref:Uncharacterized protein n=1 Tax=Helianthus annuus TaxID=4232 RepID=A0A251T8G8_HELAN
MFSYILTNHCIYICVIARSSNQLSFLAIFKETDSTGIYHSSHPGSTHSLHLSTPSICISF